MDAPVDAGREIAARPQRDRVIPLRKSDIIDGLVAEGRLDGEGQAKFRQLGRMLGAEGLRSQGIRLSWLAPTPWYIETMLSVMNSTPGSASRLYDARRAEIATSRRSQRRGGA